MWLKRRLRRYRVVGLVLLVLGGAYGCGTDPQTSKAQHMQKGTAYMAEGKYAEAIIEFRNAVAADAGDARVQDGRPRPDRSQDDAGPSR